jgi:uncharacterized delta-60 repeat protein
MKSSTLRRSLLAGTITLLSACGGGGSDNPAPADPPAAGGSSSSSGSGGANPQAAAGFSVTLGGDKAVVFQGGTATVRADVIRSGGFDGAVDITLAGLPAGVSASPAVVSAGATGVDVTLLAQSAAPHSLPTSVTVEGRALVAGSTQRATKSLTVTVRGVAGMVDTSFAGGASLTRVGTSEDYAHAVAVQADGKVLVAGSTASNQGTRIAVVRYLRDGSLDTSFGDGGKAIAAVGTREDVARAIAVQADGRIVVAGLSYQRTADYDFTLMRFMPDGTPDASFGDQGRVVTDFGGDSDRAFALLLMPDGRIVAGGQSNVNRSSTGVDFALARYLANGQLDASFGNGGKVVAAILPGSTSDMVRGLALQTVDGAARILAVGGEGDFTAARFTESGALDAGFGNAGRVSGLFGVSIGGAHAVTVLPTGEAVIAGHVGHDYAAARLTIGGQLDPRFGPAADGRFRHAMSTTNWDEATAIARQADGRLLLGGWVYSGNGTAGDFGVLRLTAEGTLDASFGQAGVMTHAAASDRTDMGRAIALQPDERVPTVRALVAGEAQDSNRDFALMRLWL